MIENPFPFVYPPQPHVRRHGPAGYSTLESFRPWLRDEFSFRCGCCLARESWWRLSRSFEIDHFHPKSQSLTGHLQYDNLLYVCNSCNAAKGSRLLPDPCEVMISPNVVVTEDGTIETRTPLARKVVRLLKLESPENNEFRRLIIGVVALAKRESAEVYSRLMGYPTDMPDLSRLRPPGGNDRPLNVKESHFARRQRGELLELLY